MTRRQEGQGRGVKLFCANIARLDEQTYGHQETAVSPARQRQADARRERARNRDRAYRKRQAAGVMTCTVEVDGEVLNFLIATRWLGEGEVGDKAKVGKAISRMLKDAAR